MNDVTKDIWARWRGTTKARIGLGRSGDALPTAPLLEFQAAHSRARDAVHGAVDFAALADTLQPHPAIAVHSQAPDRATYLRRPDLGRRLDPASADALPRADYDVAFVVADGLSARAVETHAAAVLRLCLEKLADWRIAPVVLAGQGRVALGDEIGERLNAAAVAVLIGERPGLSVADSLGIYLTWAPRSGRADSERNCISNIHAAGMSHAAASDLLVWLLREARRRKLSGIELKVDPAAALPTA
ncbi:ethanolamine ammonia-lyase subunit EutC [Ferrovibrio terrae]|uniref:ethanolamine ammonia-lyase subunit EutC n=1 Tax=Ferrovibrio terrae TaxID=2594003 RepID=UPI0031384196